MELELKHYLSYAAYDLKLHNEKEPNYPHSISFDYITHKGEFVIKDVIRWQLKPILHPLSDLTKEIEVNGKKFNPKNELYQILGGGYSSIDAFENDSWVLTMSLSDSDQSDNSVNKAPYEVTF